jgi:hypothetical protein
MSVQARAALYLCLRGLDTRGETGAIVPRDQDGRSEEGWGSEASSVAAAASSTLWQSKNNTEHSFRLSLRVQWGGARAVRPPLDMRAKYRQLFALVRTIMHRPHQPPPPPPHLKSPPALIVHFWSLILMSSYRRPGFSRQLPVRCGVGVQTGGRGEGAKCILPPVLYSQT